MIKLIDQMKDLINNALENGCPCVLATAAPDGEPDIGFKGSMMVFDDESLAYWERTKRQHLRTLRRIRKWSCCFATASQKPPGAFTDSPKFTKAELLEIKSWLGLFQRSWRRIPSAKAQPWSSSSTRSLIWADRFYKAANFRRRFCVRQRSGVSSTNRSIRQAPADCSAGSLFTPQAAA